MQTTTTRLTAQKAMENVAKVEKAFPIPAAWNSWRPTAWPGPTATQWRSFLPRPWQGKGKGKSKGKGKGKGGKGDVEMGGAGCVGQNYDLSCYYDNECWGGGAGWGEEFFGSVGCLSEWLGITQTDSAKTLEVPTPALHKNVTAKRQSLKKIRFTTDDD